MDALDRTVHRMLKRLGTGRLIRTYGVAKFTRCLRRNIWVGGREAVTYITDYEAPQIAALMSEALATALY